MGRPWRKLNYYICGVGHWPDGLGHDAQWDAAHRYTFEKAIKLAKKLAANGFKEIVIERRTRRWTQEFDYKGN